jgi:3-dehydro-L-gulonate 2-dehydrogenase
MALSHFAFGKIHNYQLRGEQLPFPGGWDDKDELSADPEKILSKERGLPIGYWKGSALSMVLDMLATLLSAGNSTFRIGQHEYETGISQVFLCIYPEMFGDRDLQQRLLNEIIDYTHDVEPMSPGDRTYFPGEKSAMTREKNLKEGIEVSDSIWKTVLDLSSGY